MIKIKADKDTYLVVDFKGLLSPCEEEVTAYRFSGKNNKAIAQILEKSPETVQRQQKKVYEKMELSGADNPLAILEWMSFKHGWVTFAAWFLMILSIFPAPRPASPARAPVAQSRRSRQDESSGALTEIVYSISNNNFLIGSLA